MTFSRSYVQSWKLQSVRLQHCKYILLPLAVDLKGAMHRNLFDASAAESIFMVKLACRLIEKWLLVLGCSRSMSEAGWRILPGWAFLLQSPWGLLLTLPLAAALQQEQWKLWMYPVCYFHSSHRCVCLVATHLLEHCDTTTCSSSVINQQQLSTLSNISSQAPWAWGGCLCTNISNCR